MSAAPARADVVIVGSGICGAASAASLAEKGVRVLVVDKEPQAAAEASGQAQGILRLQGRDAVEMPLAREALELWRRLTDDTAEIELTFQGNLYIAQDEREFAELQQLAQEARQLGLSDVSALDAASVRDLIPAARGDFVGAMWSPRDGQCDPRRVTEHFAARARRAGATFVYSEKATGIVVRDDKVRGLRLATSTIACEHVVVTAGVWTPHLLSTVGIRVPITTVCLSEGETSRADEYLRAAVRAVGFGARQRPDGQLVFSAGLNARVSHGLSFSDWPEMRAWSKRFAVHRHSVRLGIDWNAISSQVRHRSLLGTKTVPTGRAPQPDTAQLQAAHQAMSRIFPAVAWTRIERAWAGWIDMSLDGRPVIDGSAGPSGLIFITGLSGHGLTLGPVIGEIAADLVTTGTTSRVIRPFRLARFREEPVPIPRKTI